MGGTAVSNLLDILHKYYTPDQEIRGLVSRAYLYSGEKPSLRTIGNEFPEMKLTVLYAKPQTLMDGVSYLDSSSIGKYGYLGHCVLEPLDFAVMDGISSVIQARIWAHIKRLGLALGQSPFTPCRKHIGRDGWYVTRKQRWIVLSGCHRGGTAYMAKTMQAAGLDVRHQNYGYHGICGGSLVATEFIDGASVLHQVRDPLKTIESLQGVISNILRDFSVCPVRYVDGSPLSRAMKYYLWVHTMAKLRNFWTYRVEDVKNVWPEICDRIEYRGTFPGLSTDTNARDYEVPALQWHHLYDEDEYLADMIKTLSLEHGYE